MVSSNWGSHPVPPSNDCPKAKPRYAHSVVVAFDIPSRDWGGNDPPELAAGAWPATQTLKEQCVPAGHRPRIAVLNTEVHEQFDRCFVGSSMRAH
jgi:hypothetical protein